MTIALDPFISHLNALTFGGLTVPWMGDLSAYETHQDWTGTTYSLAANAWRTMVDVTGVGWLTFVRGFVASSVAPPVNVRITVDGTAVSFTVASYAPSGVVKTGTPLMLPISFKSSLKIEVGNRDSTTTTDFGCDYTYLLKTSTPNVNTQALLTAGGRHSFFHQTSSSTLVTALDITGAGYLLNLEPGVHESESRLEIWVDGARIMTNRQVMDYTAMFPAFVGPIRFATSLKIQHSASSYGDRIQGHYLLD